MNKLDRQFIQVVALLLLLAWLALLILTSTNKCKIDIREYLHLFQLLASGIKKYCTNNAAEGKIVYLHERSTSPFPLNYGTR